METLFVGRNTIFLPEVTSTNSYATDLLKNVNLPEGTVVHAANQTHGRGQRGSSWMAEPASNLTASVILKPGFLELQKQFFLYQVMALACYDTLAEILDNGQFDIKIKWPNDLLVNGRKIAGILIENTIHNGRFAWSVAGVGINVNQQAFTAGTRATSIKLLTGQVFGVQHILERLCRHIEKYYLSLKNNRYAFIQQQYLQHFLGLNSWLDFEVNGMVKPLMVCGVSDAGLLLLRDENGDNLEADVKEVKWLY